MKVIYIIRACVLHKIIIEQGRQSMEEVDFYRKRRLLRGHFAHLHELFIYAPIAIFVISFCKEMCALAQPFCVFTICARKKTRVSTFGNHPDRRLELPSETNIQSHLLYSTVTTLLLVDNYVNN